MNGATPPRRMGNPLAAVRRYCRQQMLLSPGVIVVAVSGGADSVCLLHLLHQLAPEFGLRLHVAHFHHGLRGAQADADAAFVAGLADRLRLPADFGRGDVAAVAVAAQRSLEAVAHDLRWSFLELVRRRSDATAVATGHTADDQAETVLMHLLRGAGLRGLAGLAPAGETVRRPLLAMRHDDCLTWCREHNVPWREDASNAEPWCRRNAVRLEVLPFLRRYNPAIDTALAGLAETVQVDLAHVDRQADAAWQAVVRTTADDQAQVALAGYEALPAALRRHVLLRWLGPGAERAHVQAVDDLLRNGHAGDAVAVAGNRQVIRRYGDAILAPRTRQPPLPDVTIAAPGRTSAPAWDWTIQVDLLTTPLEHPPDRWSVNLDADTVRLPLILRSRRPGDRIRLPNVAGTKKLQDLLVDAKIPRSDRERLGIVEAANGIVWLAGWRTAAGAAAHSGTERILRLTVLRNDHRTKEGAEPSIPPP
ncbi:MAG: tRNA lysidine(34) synthetase TilS [Chloroflexota bacterium]